MTAVQITGYLPKEVTDSKHRSARAASVYLRSVVKKANGRVTKLEVMMGNIFITTNDENGVKELHDALHGLQGVVVQTPSVAQLIFTQARSCVEADIVAENVAKKESQTKTAA